MRSVTISAGNVSNNTEFLVGNAIFESRQCRSETEGLIFIGGILDGGEHGEVFSQSLLTVATSAKICCHQRKNQDIFVTECDGEDALGDEVALLMNGVSWIAGIVNEYVDAFGELEFFGQATGAKPHRHRR